MTGPILIGASVLLAAAAIGVMAMLSPVRRAAFAYAQLMVMAGIYVGFAIAGLEAADFVGRPQLSAVLVESMIALGFVFAGLGVFASNRTWLLGVLILAHGGVDLLHLLLDVGYSPDWYAFACLIYDALVGVGAIWLLSKSPPAR